MRVGLAFVGLGQVGNALLRLLASEAEACRARYDMEIFPSCISDSSGIFAVSGWGDALVAADRKLSGLSLATAATGASEGVCQPGRPGPVSIFRNLALGACDAVCVLDTTPSDYERPNEAIERLEWLLEAGVNVVTANKAPLASCFRRILNACVSSGANLGFTATTGLTSPAVDELSASTAGSRVLSLEGVINGTSAYILNQMESQGVSFEAALRQAQEQGIAESDPSLDVDGWDSAAKLAILASALFGREFTLSDVERVGISQVTPLEMAAARAAGASIKLVARACAVPHGADVDVQLTVRPESLPASHSLSGLVGTEKGFVLETDLFGSICIRGGRSGIRTTAAVMMRDMLLALERM